MADAVVHHVTIYPLCIAMRRRLLHAASQRSESEPVLVRVELTSGATGWGETLPRTDVTGESVGSVIQAIQEVFLPALMTFHPAGFAESLEAIEALPWRNADGGLMAAARAAVELAMLDALMRHYRRDVDDLVQWMGLPGFGSPGSAGRIRFSGVLASDDVAATAEQLRLMYWGGLRHFKLKVGADGGRERLTRVAGYLRGPLASGRVSLRVDANGAWSKDEAIDWISDVAGVPLAAVEQPLPRGAEADLPVLRDLFDMPLMHDESLITMDDAQRLIELGVADAFNIRISKCGGLMPALRLAGLARRHGAYIQLGCMVGETSILSAAGLRFLQVCPGVEWAEGCFGSFLLRDDAVDRGLRFGYGGRPPAVLGGGLGVDVHEARVEALCAAPAIRLNL